MSLEEQQLSERVTLGLLPYINAHALDEDYAQAAARRAQVGSARERPRVGRMGAIAIAIFAVLAVTAAVQTSQDSVSEEQDRRELIDQVKVQKAALAESRRTAAQLASANHRLEDTVLRGTRDSSGLLGEVNLLRLRTGTSAVRGPGLEVLLDDAPNAQSDRNKVLDSDVQKLVNVLWQAGAEAISINGQRLTALSAIRHAGEAITVNYVSLRRPYRILAIGDRNAMSDRFANSQIGQAWLDLQRQVGLKFKMLSQTSLRMPAAEIPTLRYANQNPPGKEPQ
jgi:uncharacterized protein YlxW (UPF0749 family)